jgi:CheY-like chemotaxis protein
MAHNRPILIVEDDENVSEALCEILQHEGHITVRAGNGLEALDLLRHRPTPRLILLDLMMPVMNGWEFLGELRQSASFKRIPVVVVSAVDGDTPTGVPAVKKPISVGALLRLVDEYGA